MLEHVETKKPKRTGGAKRTRETKRTGGAKGPTVKKRRPLLPAHHEAVPNSKEDGWIDKGEIGGSRPLLGR